IRSSASSVCAFTPSTGSSVSSERASAPERKTKPFATVPLPQTIVSPPWTIRPRPRLPLIRQLHELVVGHETALPLAELLHTGEQRLAGLGVEVEAQLIRLDANRVDPALLAEDDPPVGADQRARVGLDRLRLVELARDGARLPREQVQADE